VSVGGWVERGGGGREGGREGFIKGWRRGQLREEGGRNPGGINCEVSGR
jgi:hypothetical protein